MPKSPDQEGSPRLMTISEIAEAHGVSRQTVHTYRRRGVFPKPMEGEGSTRPRFRSDEVADFFAANPKQPGRRTDRETATEGELTVPETETVPAPGQKLDPPSPSMALRQALLRLGATDDEATELMHGYAHELAERQRAAIKAFEPDDHWAVFYRISDVDGLPDLIDPEASDG